MFYGAANPWDERKFPDPHRFDVTRAMRPEQLARVGSGPHAAKAGPCTWRNSEMTAIFRALTTRVRRCLSRKKSRNVNNTLRGFKRANRCCQRTLNRPRHALARHLRVDWDLSAGAFMGYCNVRGLAACSRYWPPVSSFCLVRGTLGLSIARAQDSMASLKRALGQFR